MFFFNLKIKLFFFILILLSINFCNDYDIIKDFSTLIKEKGQIQKILLLLNNGKLIKNINENFNKLNFLHNKEITDTENIIEFIYFFLYLKCTASIIENSYNLINLNNKIQELNINSYDLIKRGEFIKEGIYNMTLILEKIEKFKDPIKNLSIGFLLFLSKEEFNKLKNLFFETKNLTNFMYEEINKNLKKFSIEINIEYKKIKKEKELIKKKTKQSLLIFASSLIYSALPILGNNYIFKSSIILYNIGINTMNIILSHFSNELYKKMRKQKDLIYMIHKELLIEKEKIIKLEKLFENFLSLNENIIKTYNIKFYIFLGNFFKILIFIYNFILKNIINIGIIIITFFCIKIFYKKFDKKKSIVLSILYFGSILFLIFFFYFILIDVLISRYNIENKNPKLSFYLLKQYDYECKWDKISYPRQIFLFMKSITDGFRSINIDEEGYLISDPYCINLKKKNIKNPILQPGKNSTIFHKILTSLLKEIVLFITKSIEIFNIHTSLFTKITMTIIISYIFLFNFYLLKK